MNQQTKPARAAVIMAAGKGTRMRSPTPKVLHKVGGRTILDRVIDAVQAAGCETIVVVVGDHSPSVGEHVRARLGPGAVAVQSEPLGTGHAVMAAEAALADFEGQVLVANGDCPLLDAADLEPLFKLTACGDAALSVLGFDAADPANLYGRMIRGANGHLLRIVEEKDATPEQRAVRACNAGMMVAEKTSLFGWLKRVKNTNAKGEYYLTDIVGLAVGDGQVVKVSFSPESSVMGTDTAIMLSQAEAHFQRRMRTRFLAEGVGMVAPDTIYFSWDTQVAPGAIIEQFVVFGQGVKVEEGALIRAFSHLEYCYVQEAAVVGPYARLRPGADIGRGAHVGNFVEVKNVTIGPGAKANHLAYLGDGSVGAGANIGAGVIFCNYDGFGKYETHVGAGAFIGSDSALVSPVRIGAGAYVGSGSVITEDVSADALGLGRARQVEKLGWATAFRAKMADRAKK